MGRASSRIWPFFPEALPLTPPSQVFLPPRWRSIWVESLAIVKTAVYCARCFGYRGETEGDDVIEWIPLCDWCRARLEGSTPQVGTVACAECGEAFEPSRYGQRFCSAACRARAWRVRRAARAAV
jgi:hypothetical protein